MNSKIVLSMLCNFSEKFNLLEREQDTMKQLEQGLLLTKGASDWLYSLLVEVPGASSLLYHSFQCRMQSNAAESDGVQPIVSAVVPGISWANSAAEVLSSLQQLYGIIVDREFKTTKDILKQWKKSTKAGVLVNTPNYEQAINDLSRVTEVILLLLMIFHFYKFSVPSDAICGAEEGISCRQRSSNHFAPRD